ncbi:MAG: hypothetical protein ABI811_13200 [Acidobacteriota bacterium]
MSITAAFAVDNKARFAPGPASSYPGHVTQEKITIGTMPYITAEQSALAFGKVKPFERGILPVLVVLQNDTGKALRLNLKAEYLTADGEHVEAMTPDDVIRFEAIQKRPGMKPPVAPIPLPRGNKKGPLNTPEIEGRAFSVKLVPPGEAASGFVYFQADAIKGAKLYLTGINDAATGKAYFYFEVPLDAK